MIRSHDDTSRALLAAAHRLLADDGPEALTVRRIANEAGMSTMNVYSRFGGKDGVIDELFADGHRRLGDTLRSVDVGADAGANMMALAGAYRSFALENPTYYGIMFRSRVPGFEPSPESVEIAIASLHFFVERIEEAQAAGEIQRSDAFTPMQIAASFWANCHGFVSLELDGMARQFVTWAPIFEQGIRAAIIGLHPASQSSTT
jgi:AcrR family transcriptional regulator